MAGPPRLSVLAAWALGLGGVSVPLGAPVWALALSGDVPPGLAVLGVATLFMSLPAAVLAIVFGVVAQSRISRSRGELSGRGIAIAAWICGIVGVVMAVLPLVGFAAAIDSGLATDLRGALTG
jgi:hypothetical protein